VSRNALVVVAILLIGLFAFTRHSPAATTGTADAVAAGHSQDPPTPGGSGSVNAHLSVVPTIRSVTVSPDSVTFQHCHGGAAPTSSTSTQMGYPNGICTVGSSGANGSFPITITYKGLPGNVWVSGSSAAPADNGPSWSLCTPGGQPACSGGQHKPGADQYTVETFAEQVANSAVMIGSPACDPEFDPSGGCIASPAEFKTQSQTEGLQLIGPNTWHDNSTSWSITITWIAES
jgi:hypothetical protein